MERFAAERSDTAVIIRMNGALDKPACELFTNLTKSWMLQDAITFVLDFSKISELSREFYLSMNQFRAALKRDGKGLYSLGLNKDLMRSVTNDGLDKIFMPIQSLEEILGKRAVPAPAPASGIDVGFINPFLSATVKTFTVQTNTPVKPLKPFLKKELVPGIAIAGVLTLISNASSGSVVLCFSESVFLKIYENMFAEKISAINAEVQDAAGELLNIIYGQAKLELNNLGHQFQPALPTVMVADQLKIRQSGSPTVVVPFETAHGNFHLEIEFKSSKGAA